MRIVKIGSRHFAAGLWWQMFSAPGTGRRKGLLEARTTAQSIEGTPLNMVALRKNQFGLGHLHSPRSGIFSLAGAVAGRVKGAWMGRFLLEEGCWWICAVSDGAIVADGDFVCASAKDADRHIADLRALLAWNAEVSFETVAESHAHLLPLITGSVRVLPLHGRKGLPPFFLPVLISAILVTLCVWLYFDKQKQSAREAAMEASRNRIFSSRALSADPDSQFPTPWKNVHPAWAATDASLKFFATQPTFVRGWELAEIEWSGGGVKSTYHFHPGAKFSALPDGGKVDPANPTICRTRRPLSLLVPPEDLKLGSVDHAAEQFFEMTRQLRAKGSLKFAVPLTKKVSDVQLTATWVSGTWRLSDLSPSALGKDLPKLLRQIPGMTVTRVLFKSSTLTLEGNVYARVPKDS